MRIVVLVIYQVVTLSGRNISRLDGSGLCSKVLGTLNCAAPLMALPVHPGRRVTGCGEAMVATGEELCQWVNCQPDPHAADSLVVADSCSVSRRPSTTIGEQFLFALLEDCSFFAHLVLRCVRGGDGWAHCVAPPSGVKPRSFSGIQRKAQPVARSYEQRELQNPPTGAAEAPLPELETLWAEVASRQVRIPVSEGGRP